MVAFNELFLDDNLEFVAGRNFTYEGQRFTAGDKVPNDLVRSASNRESLIRARYAIPVSEDPSLLPRSYGREVKRRDLVLAKFGLDDPEARQVKRKAAKKTAAKKTARKRPAKKAAAKKAPAKIADAPATSPADEPVYEPSVEVAAPEEE